MSGRIGECMNACMHAFMGVSIIEVGECRGNLMKE